MSEADLSTIDQHRAGYRSYEVHQRERPGQATPLIRPGELRSEEYLGDPYRLAAILREHYPCYRDWSGNAYWITRYDDVTSVFQDDANYETRARRWCYGMDDLGRDLGADVARARGPRQGHRRACAPAGRGDHR